MSDIHFLDLRGQASRGAGIQRRIAAWPTRGMGRVPLEVSAIRIDSVPSNIFHSRENRLNTLS